jgi:DNA modification methylase
MQNLSERPAGALSKVAFPNPETTTVWSFPVRGAWATHNNKYRGNFAPQLARNVIETYSEPGEVVLDPMAGGGTTLIEAKLLGRGFIGGDINPAAVKLCEKVTTFENGTTGKDAKSCVSTEKIVCADARDLSFLGEGSVDLILTHPPYLNIIHYSDKLSGDLSAISSVKKFCGEMRIIAGELLRVLKAGRYCAILMGDTRRGRHFVPLAYRVMDTFLDAGFILKEDIIKVQHNCSSTSRWVGKAKKAGFYLIMHEHLFVFRKASEGEDLQRFKESRKIT